MSQMSREIVLGFVAEAESYLPAIEAGLAAFATNTADPAVLEEPHRCVHTIKGASAMVGLSELSHIAFHLEEVIERLMHEPDQSTPDLLAGIGVGVGHIRKYLVGVRDGVAGQPELTTEAVRHARALRGLPEADDPVPHMPAFEEPAPAERATEDAADLTPDDLAFPDLSFPDLATTPPPLGAGEWGDDLAFPGDLLARLAAGTPEKPVEPAPSQPAASAELLDIFRAEAEEHIRVLATLLPEARTDPANKERWQAIRRSAHTLKGSAGLAGFHRVTQLAHRMEDLLDAYYDTDRVATVEEIDLLLVGTDLIAEAVEGRFDNERFATLHQQLAAAVGTEAREEAEATETLASVIERAAAPVPASEEVRAAPEPKDAATRESGAGYVRVSIERLDEIAKLVGELVIARTALEQKVGQFSRLLSEARPAADRLGRVSNRLEVGYEASALAGSRTTEVGTFALAGGGSSGGDDADAFDELEFDRYTEFHLLTRELAETTTDVQTVFGEFGHLLGEVDGELSRQSRLASQVEDKLMRLRMVPLGTVATKLHRTVRTAAAASNKKAELVIEGERTGLDKTVLEALADPLLHLLRNAVDHGLESSEVRLALGKPSAGTVTLRAAHEGSHVVLTLADDGAGIDYQHVRDAIAQKGFASPEAAATMGDEELTEFLFRPGFSTRDEVSELSGRGVGLDVVKTRIEALKGTVGVTSSTGRGTTFTIRLPLTLAVVRALLVRSHGQAYAIPLESVEQILRPAEEQLDRVGRDPVLRLGDRVYPVAPLARVLGVRSGEGSSDTRPPAVLIAAAGKRMAVQVDHLLGAREVVIKSLGRQFSRLFGVSGATLLGDGSVVPILNPAELVRGARGQTPAQRTPGTNVPVRQREGLRVLVVDDSPSVRRVLQMLLSTAGWQCTTAKDGLEALELLQRGELPDVMLTDVEMPRMDGYELLATVRSQPNLARLPVAVLTSRSADKHRRKALELGASAYVVKPYQDRDLLNVLRQLARAGAPAATS